MRNLLKKCLSNAILGHCVTFQNDCLYYILYALTVEILINIIPNKLWPKGKGIIFPPHEFWLTLLELYLKIQIMLATPSTRLAYLFVSRETIGN